MPIDPSFTFEGRSLVTTRLVETGLYLGATVRAALAAGFAEVYSVELDPGRYRAGEAEFAADPRVRLFHGSSPDALPRMLDPAVPTLVYLDAHAMGGGPVDPAYGECPLLAELAAVRLAAWRERPVVVVDDAHMLRRPWHPSLHARFTEAAWPVLAEVKSLLPDYEFRETCYALYCFPK